MKVPFGASASIAAALACLCRGLLPRQVFARAARPVLAAVVFLALVLGQSPAIAGPTPNPPTAVVADDGVAYNFVWVTFNAPSQAGVNNCSTVDYLIYRNGTLIGTKFAVATAGEIGVTFPDTNMVLGTVYTYGVAAKCSPSGNVSTTVTNTGYASGPVPVTGVGASDGAFTDRIRVTFTAPDQTVGCSAVSYQVLRDGTQIGTVSSVPVTGGAGSFDDMSPGPNGRLYAIKSTCTPSGTLPGYGTPTSGSDGGYMDTGTPLSNPIPATINGTGVNMDYGWAEVYISTSPQGAVAGCGPNVTYELWAEGNRLVDQNTVQNNGFGYPITFMDLTPGVHTYFVRAVCSLSGTYSDTSTFIGWDGNGSPTIVPPMNFSASDAAFADRVRITYTMRDQAGSDCWNLGVPPTYRIYRNGSVIQTFTNQPVNGSATPVVYDDLTAAVGTTYTYYVQITCGALTGQTSTDTGSVSGGSATPLAATAVAASDGTDTTKITVTFTAPDQSAICTSISYVLVRDAADLTTISTIPLAGGAGSYDDTTASIGTHSYSVRSVCTPGGGTASSPSDTGFKQGTPLAVTAVAASDATFSNKIAVTFTASDQSAQCSSIQYVVVRGSTDVGTITTIPLTGGAGGYDDTTAPAGSQTYTVRSVCSPGNTTATSASDVGSLQAVADSVLFVSQASPLRLWLARRSQEARHGVIAAPPAGQLACSNRLTYSPVRSTAPRPTSPLHSTRQPSPLLVSTPGRAPQPYRRPLLPAHTCANSECPRLDSATSEPLRLRCRSPSPRLP